VSEASFQGAVIKQLRARHLAVARISNSAHPGTPDLAFADVVGGGWIEIKFKLKWPVRGGPMKVGLRREQTLWLLDWPSRRYVLAKIGRVMWLFDGRWAMELDAGITQEWAVANCTWSGTNWDELVAAI
jgi:hypothetical protein